jgi:hypothetical protein
LAIAKKNLGCAVRERKCISGLFIYLSPPMPKRVDKDIGRVQQTPLGAVFSITYSLTLLKTVT